MALNRNNTRSQQNLSAGEGLLHTFDVDNLRKEKKNGSSPNLSSGHLDLPTEAKRRRVTTDDVMSVTSTVSSQVSSRCHSPTLSEFDDSFMSTPGNSPSATLKEKFRRKYGRNELLSAIDQYLMDSEIIDVCKSQDEDDVDSQDNTKFSLAEFRKQYQELSEWLNQVLKVTQKSPASLTLSEKYLTQSYHEELLLQSGPRQKTFVDYARQLLQRYPHLKHEIDERVHHVSSQWEQVEKAVSSKGMWQNIENMYKDMASDLRNLNVWLEDTHRRLMTMTLKPPSNSTEKETCLADHQVLQKDIESHSRNINAVLKLIARLQDEFDGFPDQAFLDLEHEANKLHTRWQEIWLQSVEWQCKLENALKSSKVTSTPRTYLTDWIPRHFGTEHDSLSGSLGEDSLTSLLPRQADLIQSPPYDCSLSASGDNSGKDSAVVSEADIKMSSECSDSDLDMLRKSRLRSENRDIGYSSGTSASPITAGQTSTESDCDNIRKLIEGVDSLVKDGSPKPKSPARQRKSESPCKQRPPDSSCDASSEESELSGEEFSTASDNADALYDSMLGLDYNSDEPVPTQNLPRFCNTAKLRQGHRKKKDRPWSVVQMPPLDDLDLMDLSKSDTAIDKIKDASDSSETPKQRLRKGPATLPRAGAKRKLYESHACEDTLEDSDAESSTSEDYETARSDASMSEPEDHMTSTASFSEPTWDNYHPVYTSLGEEDEQQLTWTPLEEDLEFDEEFPSAHKFSVLQQVLDRRKVKTKPRLVSQGSRHDYDSDSDMEDLIYLINESSSQLKIAEHHLKKKSRDYLGTGVDINTNRYGEIIATCETNIKCLQNVLQHLDVDVTEEETEKIKEILYQWEKLYAFAMERQSQSQQLSVMSKLLEDIQTDIDRCAVGSHKVTYPNIRELEACLISSKTSLEGLSSLQCRTEELQTKTGAFQMEHPAINILLFTQLLKEAEVNLRHNRDMLSKTIPQLQQTYDLWEKYNQTKEELDLIMSQEFQLEFSALRQSAASLESEENLKELNSILLRYDDKTRHLQTLRGQLMELVDPMAQVELTNDVANALDRLTDAQRQYRTLMWSVDQEINEHMEQVEEEVKMAAAHPTTSSSSPSSSSSSWYKSRYIKAAGAFMFFGLASYFVDPDALKRLGDLTVTLTPELRYVNGPPPI